jgi:hypothetical protein
MTIEMKIDKALIYWYYVSWSFVGCNSLGYCAFGCHVHDNDDPNYGALDCASVLDSDAMVGPRKNSRPSKANYSLICRAKSFMNSEWWQLLCRC